MTDIPTAGSANPTGEAGSDLNPDMRLAGTSAGFEIRETAPIPVRADSTTEV
jgi:hypothetical protein